MKYIASIQDFFKSPRWGMNMLLGAVTSLIPFVGPIVLSGWHTAGFWGRRDDSDASHFPDFDFGNFSKYLQLGLWPFLVSLVAGLIMVPVMVVLVFVGVLFFSALAPGFSRGEGNVALAVILGLLLMVVYVALIIVAMLVQVPLVIRATITQEFGAAFNLAFVKRFLGLVWKESLLASLFLAVISPLLALVGVLACFVGTYFVIPLIIYASHHLQKQLYHLYLARGGEPVPASAKLIASA